MTSRSLRNITLILLSLTTACSSAHRQQEVISTYQQGYLAPADELLSEQIAHEMPQNAYWKSKNAVTLLLDRATIRFTEGDTSHAIQDYDLALQALDYYGQDSTIDTAGQLLFEDGCGAYCGSNLEQILARVYFALTLLHQGDENNACALLRQAEELQQRFQQSIQPYLKDHFCNDNALAKYLLALLLEYQDDTSNAAILYQQVQELNGILPVDLNLCTEAEKHATLVIICHNGNVPFKISDTCPASIASALALEMILASQDIRPAYSSFTGIPVPALCQQWPSCPLPTTISLDGVCTPLSPILDVAAAAYNELEYKKPLIVARGVARFLLRRTAVAFAEGQDPCLGALVDFGIFIANASTKADTRSWRTLPSSIDLIRYRLAPGLHNIGIAVTGYGNNRYEEQCCIVLKAHDLCVINIFNIHPHVTINLIPTRFLKGE